MRIAVLSDIHANLEALNAVVEDCRKQRVEEFWFLGDVAGYGPDVVPVARFIQNHVHLDSWVLGNHDAIVSGLLTAEELSATGSTALHVAELHRSQLAAESDVWRFWESAFTDERRLPCSKVINGRLHTLTHAGQTERHILRYIYPWQKEFFLQVEMDWLAEQEAETKLTQIQWVGHTHVPMLVRYAPESGMDAEWVKPCGCYALDERLTLVNPGSVGQPRDGDSRAAYVIYDSEEESITFCRVAYVWQEPFRKINELTLFPGMYDWQTERLREQIIDNLKVRLATAVPVDKTPSDWREHYQYAATIGCNGYFHV